MESMMMLLAYCMIVIICYMCYKFIKFIWFMVRCYILPSFGFVVDLKKFGKWAVVTGATSGIGKAYAEQLAKRGLDIVLISRNEDKLKDCAASIRERFGVETKIVTFDFGSVIGYDSIKQDLHGLDIGVLINNVGVSEDTGKKIFIANSDKISYVAIVNMLPDINMTHMVMQRMSEKKRGVVVHISSAASYGTMTLFNVYPATKAFVNRFAEILRYESDNVIHQVITPADVTSNMNRQKPSFTVASAEQFANSAINTIGIADEASGYWVHEIICLLIRWLPFWLYKSHYEEEMLRRTSRKEN